MKNDKIKLMCYESFQINVATGKPRRKKEKQIKVTLELEKKINDLIANAIRTDVFIDDSVGTLMIVYENGIKVLADRGLTDGQTHLIDILDI